MRTAFYVISLLIIALLAWAGIEIWIGFFVILALVLIPILIGVYDTFQSKHAIKRNFPLVGRSRYAAEWLRPKLYQYFVESDTEGAPIARIFRSIIYQRSKKDTDTTPFGTQLNVYAEGYEWMNHSILPIDHHDINPDQRITVGGPDCKKPYELSLLNISAMSYGSLSAHAIKALNGGASIGGFAHNTGEGGISAHHMEFGGDLIYQIGTGYFGCRNDEGGFSEENFLKTIGKANVKMIEIKLSQGAKPGHGGILPAKKVTPEIAEIRNVPLGKDVLSPPYHKEFNTPIGLLNFVKKLRDLSEGLPVGFKLCVGHRSEFISICRAMVETGIYPDFIAVDGGEGGTGAAPLEFSNSVGMPYREGLAIVYDTLKGFDLKQHIKIIAAGKISTGFHMVRAIAIGADACYSARAMMMSLGCIQALECNRNTCPVGVATNDKSLMKGLVVSDKKVRVANFHKQTLKAFIELMGAAGIKDSSQINRYHIHRRIIMNRYETYEDVYPYISEGCLLKEESYPKGWERDLGMATAKSFYPRFSSAFVDED
ncbi:MAG: FMN-binding glutamate synthase family protein [Saprospiraceae bacterium]|nr:FMN-binding glutamate synthase family protein [Saprospiraceae bacterium]